MGHDQSQSYVKQFLGSRPEAARGAVDPGDKSYRQRFLAESQGQGEVTPPAAEVPPLADAVKPPPEPPVKDTRFLWSQNVARFPEQDLPFLSKTSVKQLEANFRELMIVEANIAGLVNRGNTIYVSSCSDRDGKTIAATSTAYALSFYSGKNVLLVDGNHHNPQIHSLFGVSESPGFHELAQGRASLEQVILPTRHKGLSILTLGERQEIPYGAEKLAELLGRLSLCFDYVVWDGGSIMTSSLALRDIVHFAGVLLVVECERTRWELVQVAGDKIRKGGGPSAIGVVYNRRKYYIPKGIYNLIS